MDWSMNHQDISVRSVPSENTNTQDQTICKGKVPQCIAVMAKNGADLSLVDTFV